MTFLRSLCALILCSAVLSAQNREQDILAVGPSVKGSGGGIFLIDPVLGTAKALLGVSGDLKLAHAIVQDPYNPTAWYVGTDGSAATPQVTPNVYRILAGTGRVFKATKLNRSALTGDLRIEDLRVVGDRLLILTSSRIAWLPVAGGNPTTVLKHTNRWPAMDTDGRYAYVNLVSSGNGSQSLHRFDLQDPKNASKWKLLYSPKYPFPTRIQGITMAGDGNVFVVDRDNRLTTDVSRVDPRTGKLLQKINVSSALFWGGTKAVEDPRTGDLVILGKGRLNYGVVTYRNGKLYKALFGGFSFPLTGIDVRRAPRLFRFGYACAPSFQPEPWMYGNSVPYLGNLSYGLILLAPANTAGLFLLGTHGALPKPIPLGFLGMGKCELGLAPLLSFPILVPKGGKLSLPLPIASSLSKANLDVQFALLDPKANTTGMITTRVGSILIR